MLFGLHQERREMAIKSVANYEQCSLRLLEILIHRGTRQMRSKQNTRISGRRKSLKSIGRSLARALDFQFAKAATIAYSEVARDLRKLERIYLAQLEGTPELKLEVRRRISEHLLAQAILHRCPQQTCRSRLRAAARLGFTNIEQEAHYRLLYAKGSLARGHRQTAERTASEIAEKLERSLKRQKSLLAQQCLTRAREFLAHLSTVTTSPDA